MPLPSQACNLPSHLLQLLLFCSASSCVCLYHSLWSLLCFTFVALLTATAFYSIMRYENWDVLLFPEGSKVPIQEFKTQCFVTKDSDSPYLQIPTVVNPLPYYPIQGNIGQMPVLTTFIPSLPKDSPFRVSIHSWEKPRPSRFIERMMQPDDVLLFEARVFLDGVLTA